MTPPTLPTAVREALSAFDQYTHHDMACHADTPSLAGPIPCTCGYDVARAALESAIAQALDDTRRLDTLELLVCADDENPHGKDAEIYGCHAGPTIRWGAWYLDDAGWDQPAYETSGTTVREALDNVSAARAAQEPPR